MGESFPTLVSERLQGVRDQLPAGAEANLGPLSAANSEIYMYTVSGGGKDLAELRTLHDRVVRPQFRTVPGVTEVNAFGGYVRQAQVIVRPNDLVSRGLTLHDVVEAVKAELKLPALQVKQVPVISQTRLPLVANGTTNRAD